MPASRRSKYLHCDIAAAAGSGWMDACLIPRGLAIGRCDYVLHAPWGCDYTEPLADGIGVYVLLSGQTHLSFAGQCEEQELSGSTTYLCDHSGSPQQLSFLQAADRPYRGISLNIPSALLMELSEDAQESTLPTRRPTLPGYVPMHRRHGCHSLAVRIAQDMLAVPAATVVGRLHLESLALELVAAMAGHLSLCADKPDVRLPHRHRIAVEEAMGILELEYAQVHTIASLARRVSLNECYLKAAFRHVTGHTMADYLRRLRMRHARRLIEDRRATVLQTATFVGYSNPSHFSQAFKAVYGIPPSALKQ